MSRWLTTTSRDGSDPEGEVFLSSYEITEVEKQVDDAISQTGGWGESPSLHSQGRRDHLQYNWLVLSPY